MCKCNQGANRVDVAGIRTLNKVRMFLMVARRQKQMAEITRDYVEGGGPQRLLQDARIHEASARQARRQTKDQLMVLEKRFGGAYVRGEARSLVSAKKLNGWHFETWEPYREIFDNDTIGCVDIWR